MSRLVSHFALAAFAVIASRRAAHAEPPRTDAYRLVYERTPAARSCPEEAAFARAVALRVGRDRLDEGASRRIEVTIARAAGRFVGRIRLTGDGGAEIGTRSFESTEAECTDLFTSMAFAASLAIDPMGRAGKSTEEPLPPLPPAPPPPRSTEPIVVPHREPTLREEPASSSAATPLTWQVGAGVRMLVGFAPAAQTAFAVDAGARGRPLSLAVEGAFVLPASATVGDAHGARSSFLFGALVPCAHRSMLAACAVVGAGAYHAQAFGVDRPASADAFFALVGARVALEPNLAAGFRARLHADALVPITPTTLRIDGRDVWSTSFVGIAGGAALVRAFP